MAEQNPSAIFYFNDWENDKKLKLCSLAAQGLWMRLLCIAAASPERGVVQIGDLNLSLPDGLAHIALAVGRPLEEIAPLIDELVSKDVASVDRRKRIYNRRMVARAALSGKRSIAGKLGAQATNGKERRKEDLPRQNPGKPPPLHDSHPPNSLLITETSTVAASASASPDGPPRPRLPDTAKWVERLAGHRPLEGKPHWKAEWGLSPDSSGTNPLIPPALLADWRKTYREQLAEHRASIKPRALA
jgi:hypothetical protein